MAEGQEFINKNLVYYCERFAQLNPSRIKKKESGNAPYKPILLLSVIELISQGTISDNHIYVSDELINTFNKYWNCLASNSAYRGGLHYPFIHLESEGFWQVEFKPDCKKGRKLDSTKALREAVEYATLDSELFTFIQDPVAVTRLIDALIDAWFSSSREQIEEILQVNQNLQEITQEEINISDSTVNFLEQPKVVLKKSLVRNAFFRKAVVQIYDYKCAFCQMKVMNSLRQNIVDGAHIKPFAEFFDSRVNNGLSLCKNHHWAFDQGWFSINDEYRIIVASDLEEESPNAKPMRDFHGKLIIRPNSEQYFPSLEALQWHRLNRFRN